MSLPGSSSNLARLNSNNSSPSHSADDLSRAHSATQASQTLARSANRINTILAFKLPSSENGDLDGSQTSLTLSSAGNSSNSSQRSSEGSASPAIIAPIYRQTNLSSLLGGSSSSPVPIDPHSPSLDDESTPSSILSNATSANSGVIGSHHINTPGQIFSATPSSGSSEIGSNESFDKVTAGTLPSGRLSPLEGHSCDSIQEQPQSLSHPPLVSTPSQGRFQLPLESPRGQNSEPPSSSPHATRLTSTIDFSNENIAKSSHSLLFPPLSTDDDALDSIQKAAYSSPDLTPVDSPRTAFSRPSTSTSLANSGPGTPRARSYSGLSNNPDDEVSALSTSATAKALSLQRKIQLSQHSSSSSEIFSKTPSSPSLASPTTSPLTSARDEVAILIIPDHLSNDERPRTPPHSKASDQASTSISSAQSDNSSFSIDDPLRGQEVVIPPASPSIPGTVDETTESQTSGTSTRPASPLLTPTTTTLKPPVTSTAKPHCANCPTARSKRVKQMFAISGITLTITTLASFIFSINVFIMSLGGALVAATLIVIVPSIQKQYNTWRTPTKI